MSDIKQIVGSGIRFIRTEKGLTQETLAVKAGVSSTYMGEVERGNRNILLETLEKIAEALEVLPVDILLVKGNHYMTKGNDKVKSLDKFISFLATREQHEIDAIHKVSVEIVRSFSSK